jgi:hypothetical protein
VYDLAITPDGSLGAVATGAGKLSIINLRPNMVGAVSVRQLPPMPILSTHYITAVRFIDRDSLAVGVIQAYGPRPWARFYAGAVLVLKTSGEPTIQRAIELPEPATWSPALDVNFGSPIFAAYTPKSAIFVKIQD